MFTCEKALLKTYGTFADVVELMDESFLKRAVSSHTSKLSAFDEAERLIEMIELKKDLIDLYGMITDALADLKRSDYILLDGRYSLTGETQTEEEKNRNYYRRLAIAVGRFAYAVRRRGVNEEKFSEYAKKFHFIEEAYSEEKAKEKDFFKGKKTIAVKIQKKDASDKTALAII